jgi:hypothetical protein
MANAVTSPDYMAARRKRLGGSFDTLWIFQTREETTCQPR